MSMKKCVLFCLLLMATVGMQAQSLDGTWKYKEIEDDTADLFIVFNNGSLSLDMSFAVSNPTIGEITLWVLLPGSYTRDGNKLITKSIPEQCDVKIKKIEFTDELVQKFKKQPELEQTIWDALEEKFKEHKDNFAKNYPKFGTLSILKLTDTELWICKEDDAKKIVLTRCTE